MNKTLVKIKIDTDMTFKQAIYLRLSGVKHIHCHGITELITGKKAPETLSKPRSTIIL